MNYAYTHTHTAQEQVSLPDTFAQTCTTTTTTLGGYVCTCVPDAWCVCVRVSVQIVLSLTSSRICHFWKTSPSYFWLHAARYRCKGVANLFATSAFQRKRLRDWDWEAERERESGMSGVCGMKYRCRHETCAKRKFYYFWPIMMLMCIMHTISNWNSQCYAIMLFATFWQWMGSTCMQYGHTHANLLCT